MKQYNFQNNYGVIAFVVVNLCSSFPIDPIIFPEGQIFTKKYHFRRFWGQGHIFKAIAVKFGMRVRSWGFLLQAKYCKNRLRGIPLLGKFILEITNFSNLCGVNPHFKSENSEIWRECTDPGHPPCP